MQVQEQAGFWAAGEGVVGFCVGGEASLQLPVVEEEEPQL